MGAQRKGYRHEFPEKKSAYVSSALMHIRPRIFCYMGLISLKVVYKVEVQKWLELCKNEKSHRQGRPISGSFLAGGLSCMSG